MSYRVRLLVALAGLFLLLHPAPGQASVPLTDAERTFLRDLGPVPYCADPDWEPFEVVTSKGEHVGIGADLLRLGAERAGVPLVLVPTRDWDESIAFSKQGRCRLLSFLNQTPKREQWLTFTDPLFTDVNVIITREEHPFVIDLGTLQGEVMALPRGTSIEERVRRDYPNLSIVTTDTEAEALALVTERKAHMTMRSRTVAAHTIKSEGWFNLKIAGQVQGYENRLRVGVSKDLAPLRDILNKGIATIGPAERGQIVNRHVSIRVETAMDYALIAKIVAVFALILATNLFWIRKLQHANRLLRVKSETDILTNLYNRAELNNQFGREIDRARRYNRPLSVILLDLDHFKRINDELGHLAGDAVLVDFAQVARAAVRGEDVVGRWGGEEFLVLCPETTGDQALALADRIREQVQSHPFQTGKQHTVSAGVATLRPEDGMDSLLHRADESLYRAKAGGRNQACQAEG